MLANKMMVNEEIVNPMSCPRCVEDVYSLGIELQNYVGNTYLDLARQSREPQKSILNKMAARKFDSKDKISSLINADLNQALAYFYENGGPVMDPPVTDLDVKDIYPFFHKTISNFFSQLDAMVYVMGKGEMSTSELEHETYNYIIGLFTILGRLYQATAIREAFDELSRIEMSSTPQYR